MISPTTVKAVCNHIASTTVVACGSICLKAGWSFHIVCCSQWSYDFGCADLHVRCNVYTFAYSTLTFKASVMCRFVPSATSYTAEIGHAQRYGVTACRFFRTSLAGSSSRLMRQHGAAEDKRRVPLEYALAMVRMASVPKHGVHGRQGNSFQARSPNNRSYLNLQSDHQQVGGKDKFVKTSKGNDEKRERGTCSELRRPILRSLRSAHGLLVVAKMKSIQSPQKPGDGRRRDSLLLRLFLFLQRIGGGQNQTKSWE